jgi:hypothetical protein
MTLALPGFRYMRLVGTITTSLSVLFGRRCRWLTSTWSFDTLNFFSGLTPTLYIYDIPYHYKVSNFNCQLYFHTHLNFHVSFKFIIGGRNIPKLLTDIRLYTQRQCDNWLWGWGFFADLGVRRNVKLYQRPTTYVQVEISGIRGHVLQWE